MGHSLNKEDKTKYLTAVKKMHDHVTEDYYVMHLHKNLN